MPTGRRLAPVAFSRVGVGAPGEGLPTLDGRAALTPVHLGHLTPTPVRTMQSAHRALSHVPQVATLLRRRWLTQLVGAAVTA